MPSPKAPLGVLLLHGWNSTGQVFQHLLPAIAALGLPCRAPTYTGHGHPGPDGAALRGVRWQRWHRDAAEALTDLLAEAERAVIVGHSMGGWLALTLSVEHRARVDGVVVAGGSLRTASWLGPGRPLHALAPLLPRVWPSVRRRPRGKFGAPDVRPGYATVPATSVLELFGLLKATRALLARVDAPLLVLHGRRDATNAPAGAPALLRAVATPAGAKRLQWLETADHQLFLGAERATVNDAVLAFLRERMASAPATPRPA